MSQLTRRSFLAFMPAMLAYSSNAAEWLRYEPIYRHGRPYPRTGKFSHTEPGWKELRQGLYFSRLTVYRNSEPVDSMGLVKANPEYNRFAVFHDRKNEKTIEEWQAHTGAEVTFNSSYYQDTRDPAGLIITGGRMKGPKVNKAMKGMFVAEPVDGRKPFATVLNFAEDSYDYKTAPWTEGVQSFPLLLDSRGNIGVTN